MKKLLGIVLLGLLWCSASFAANIANCEQTPTGNISGNKYTCTDDDTFDNTGGHTITNNTIVITTAGSDADGVTIKNSGTIVQDTHATKPAINGNSSTNLKITNNSGGTIQSTTKTVNINNGANAEIDNAGSITSDNDYAIKSNGTGLEITNSGTITAVTLGINIDTNGANTNITNSGNIYGTTDKAIVIIGDNATITNQSGSTIRAGSADSTTDAHVNAVLFNSADDSNRNGTLENYGTLTSARTAVKVNMQNLVINNYSGATIQITDTDGETAAIQISDDNATITNKGTLTPT